MLKSGVYPGASPPRDAPSPTANDDPFSEGVETAYNRRFCGHACLHIRRYAHEFMLTTWTI